MLSFNLMFDGNCREAVEFYCEVFDKPLPVFTTYGESDTSFDQNVQLSEKGKSLIMNAGMEICGTHFLFNDMPDNFEFARGNSFGIRLNFDDVKTAQKIFEDLCENGQVFVPFSLLGAGHYGMGSDKFNVVWTVTC